MINEDATVFVVDDETAILNALTWLFRRANLKSETFLSAEAFLEAYEPDLPGCLLVGVKLPGMSGLDLLDILATRKIRIPVIAISGYGDVQMVKDALRAGAVDFFEKPFDDGILLGSIENAIDLDATIRRASRNLAENERKLSLLTAREREVMDMVIAGKSSRAIAHLLGTSVRTVEVHRAKIMGKMGVDSVLSLVRMVMSINCAYVRENSHALPPCFCDGPIPGQP